MMEEAMQAEIVERLKAIVRRTDPGVAFVSKYGGTVVESRPGHPKTQFCGVFAYQNHVSLEFTKGAQLHDPQKILLGGGKLRRHVKVARLSDIDAKRCEDFLRQARRLQTGLP